MGAGDICCSLMYIDFIIIIIIFFQKFELVGVNLEVKYIQVHIYLAGNIEEKF